MIDLWIQALNEASEDKVIAAAVRKQIREVHDFFADVIRDGQRRGVIHADRDPVAEAWIFVAGGLLATIDGRLGGLLGDDLARGARVAARVDDGRRTALSDTEVSGTFVRPGIEPGRRSEKAPAAAPGALPGQAGAGWAAPTRLCGPDASDLASMRSSPHT